MANSNQLVSYEGNDIALEDWLKLQSFRETRSLFSAQSLMYLTRKLKRHPHCLITHVRRIYCCYQQNLNDALYAAVVDLLLVLNHRGREISKRMVFAVRHTLPETQAKILERAVIDKDFNLTSLEGNRFSLMTAGSVGKSKVVEKFEGLPVADIDPLQLAHDAIEYSQLEEAMSILERVMLSDSKNQACLQLLTELYTTTKSYQRLMDILHKFKCLKLTIPECWLDLSKSWAFNSQPEL